MKLISHLIFLLILSIALFENCDCQTKPKPALTRPGAGAKKPSKLSPGAKKLVDKYKNQSAFKASFNKAKVEDLDPKIKLEAEEAMKAALGHGGRYDALQAIVSTRELIESDHAPHSSILGYLDPKNVKDWPPSIQADVEERLRLQEELEASNFKGNEARIKTLSKEIGELEKKYGADLPDKFQQKDWPAKFKTDYETTIDNIKKLYKAKPVDPLKEQEFVKELKKIREDAVKEMVEKIKGSVDPVELAKLENYRNEKRDLEFVNKELGRELEDFVGKLKGKMGVLSIPFEQHRNFPSTGSSGVPQDIQDLKTKGVGDAEKVMETMRKDWMAVMETGLNQNYYPKANTPKPDLKTASPQEKEEYFRRVWDANFEDIYPVWISKDTGKTPAEKTRIKTLKDLKPLYAKFWMSRVIHSLKGKDFKGMMSLFINEYKLYLGSEFDYYKKGIQRLLETNEKFGWLQPSDSADLIKTHGLDKGEKSPPGWDKVEKLIVASEESRTSGKVKTPVKRKSATKVDGVACKKGKTSKLFLGQSVENCIFHIKDKEEESHKVRVEEEDEIFPKPKVIDHGEELLSIDSRQLSEYLESFGQGELDFESLQTKEAVAEFASKNKDKLVGDEESIARSKALIKQELLEIHNNQNSLSNSINNAGSEGGHFHSKSISNYQRVKVSMSRFANRASSFTSTTEKVGGAYGKIMLAKGVVSALRHGDYTSLAIMGGRVGLDVGLHAVEKVGSLLVKKVGTKLAVSIGSKMSSVIGKVAGPIGAVADIGISIYSLSNSIKALNNPAASKWEQNDAIADIVADSIDIAVTATAAIASIVFPPAAPLFAAVALIVNIFTTIVVSGFKAVNHVNELNDAVPLLDYEKVEEGLRFMEGMGTSMYLEDLIKTKKVNNMVVNMTVLWLKDNPEFIGKVFPSQTLYNPLGDCRLIEHKYTYPGPLNDWISDKWNCGKGKGNYCQGTSRKCEYDEVDYRFWGAGTVIRYYCECDPEPGHSFDGYDILDNRVDFRSKRSVYLERWAPNHLLPPGFNYLCKPGSDDFVNDRITERSPTYNQYLCEGAIGIERSSGAGRFMLYDLKTGRDEIYLSSVDNKDSLILVGDGEKEYIGGGGDDTFMIDGPCSALIGELDGGGYKGEGNSLIFSGSCSKGGLIDINLPQNKVKFPGNKAISVSNIERVIGRKGEKELIAANCKTKLIAGQGGRNNFENRDRIILPSCPAMELDIAILGEGWTELDFGSYRGGRVALILKDGQPSFSSEIPVELEDAEIILRAEGLGGLSSLALNGQSLQLQFGSGGHANLTFKCGSSSCTSLGKAFHAFFLDEGKLPYQLLIDTGASKAQALFRLQPLESRRVVGVSFLSNIFYLAEGGIWDILGSDKENDVFYLQNVTFSGRLDGGGGSNTLVITTDVDPKETIMIDGEGLSYLQRTERIGVTNFNSIVGREKAPELVIVHCGLRQLDLGGGSETAPDGVNIDSEHEHECSHDLTVFAKGHTAIHCNSLGKGQIFVQIGPEKEKTDLKLNLYQRAPDSKSAVVLLMNFKISDISLIFSAPIFGNSHQLKLPNTEINVVGKFLENDSINFPIGENTVQSVIIQVDSKLVAFHNLPPNSNSDSNLQTRNVSGIPFIENRFRIQEGRWNIVMSPINQWEGDKGDIFIVEANKVWGHFDGGKGLNTITFDDKIAGKITMSLDGSLILEGGNISTNNIQIWQGRGGKVEEISVDLGLRDYKLISLNGGAEQPDKIFISNSGNGEKNLTVIATGTTFASFKNSGSGFFEIYIQPEPAGLLKFEGDFVLGTGSKYTLPIKVPPHKISDSVVKVVDPENIYIVLNISSSSFIQFSLNIQKNESDFGDFLPIFVSDSYNPEGQLVIDFNKEEVTLVTVCASEAQTAENSIKRGAVGIKNIFRIEDSFRVVHGGKLDDGFVLENNNFSGELNGYGGINSLILSDSLNSSNIQIDLEEETLNFEQSKAVVKGILIVNGRKGKPEKLSTACNTALVKLEGGSSTFPDVITVPKSFCQPQMTIVTSSFTSIQNLAEGGNFTYLVEDLETLDISYNLGANISHHFKFQGACASQVKSLELASQATSFVIVLHSGERKYFPIFDNNLGSTTFQFIQNNGMLIAEVDIDFEQNGNIYTRGVANPSFSGDILGFNGAQNSILVQSEDELGKIVGGDLNDDIFLFEYTHNIDVIDGKGRDNRLQLMSEFWSGYNLDIDLRQNKDNESFAVTIVQKDEDEILKIPLIREIKHIQMFTGRGSSFDKVWVACDTSSVANAEVIIVTNSSCNYNLWLTIAKGTRVMFVIKDDTFPNDENVERNSTYEIDDDCKEIKQLNTSTFYYNFQEPTTFDIEVDDDYRLFNTQHIFNLKLNLSDLKSISVSQNNQKTRLVYSLHSTSLEYSHALVEFDETELFYSNPAFMTEDGFQILISKYSEIIFSFGNLEEILEFETVQELFIPKISQLAQNLGASFMIETGSDFIYSGNPKEISTLSNRENITSHLIGFNGTTYQVLGSMAGDVYIYASSQGDQVIDLTSIISQIKNSSGQFYLPKIVQNSTNLQISFPAHPEIFGGKIVLVNGTEKAGDLKVLLRTIAMNIKFNDGNWLLEPEHIKIQHGHTLALEPHDFEHGTQVRDAVKHVHNVSYICTRNEDDLIVTNIHVLNQVFDTVHHFAPTSFIISNYFKEGDTSMPKVHIKLGKGNESLCFDEDYEIVSTKAGSLGSVMGIQEYKTVLIKAELDILEGFPDIPKMFNSSGFDY